MSPSLLFAPDVSDPFTALPSAPNHLTPGSQYSSSTREVNRINTWLTQQQYPQQRSVPQMHSSMSQQDNRVEDHGSQYTFTTQGPTDMSHHHYSNGSNAWNLPASPLLFPASSVLSDASSSGFPQSGLSHAPFMSESWPQLDPYSPVPQQHSSTYDLGDFSQGSQMSNGISSYNNTTSSSLMTPTTSSDPSLSPLSGYSTSPQLPTPTTPMSPSQKISQSPTSPYEGNGLLILGQSQSSSSDPDRKQYTHKEQLTLFRLATEMPLDGAGPFVPQQMYKPHTTSDRKRYVEEVLLEAPLYFHQTDNPTQYGISLRDALHSRTKKLADRDQVVFEGRGPSVSIRLEWPGYRQWSRQIPTKDFRSPPGPITLAKLAKNVAKCVQRFMQDRKTLPLEDEADQSWRVGDAPNDIKLEDLVLVSIHHVSLGSWQPQLRLLRPRPQRFGPLSAQQRHRQAQVPQGQAAASALVMTPPSMLPLTPMSASHALPGPTINGRGPGPQMAQSYFPHHHQIQPHH